MASMYEVELTLSSAKDLKNINWRHGPTRPYVVAWIDSDRKFTSRIDDEGDTCPKWNQTLTIPLDRQIEGATLYIDVVHHATLDEDDIKLLIGSGNFNLSEVIDDMLQIGDRVPHSLKLKRPSGRPQGTLELEIVVHDPYSRGSDYSYPTINGSAPKGTGYPYEQPPRGSSYGDPGYGKPAYEEKKKKDAFGGTGMTGLAIGATTGVVGGIALAEGFYHIDDEDDDEYEFTVW
ncbi:uncharacterized protein [Spinacia oleracea]|uniref:C2 domain-containing protein n=1 Tax=Spinacia oleracea TaxID=3562 RepID=A0A9R0JRD7_SPIOL|nr:uncharacterized protein LOC110784187 [Spinacia oleracea]